MELAKIEAFDSWIQKQPATEEQMSAQTLLHKVTARINHAFKTLRSQLHQVTTEKYEFQTKFEQQEEKKTDLYPWEHLLEFEKIEDPGNTIIVTMKNLAPSISIFQ